jgi:hypothetical protein
MKRLSFSAIAVFAIFTGSALRSAEGIQSGPQAGKPLPGPFDVLNATGAAAGRFHCPVCDHGLRPTVLVFFKDLKGNDDPVIGLLKGLEGLIEAQPRTSLGAVGVLMNDGGYKELLQTEVKVDEKSKVADLPLTKAILFKDEKLTQLAGAAKEAKFNHVSLALDGPGGPKEYQINPEADVTVILYAKFTVLGNWAFGKDFTAEQANKVLGEIKAKLPKDRTGS